MTSQYQIRHRATGQTDPRTFASATEACLAIMLLSESGWEWFMP